ncbi:MAG: IgGFc-binding protein [Nannocystis sp.]|uniref:IgGFc-binding protein n=1 Tax=Nannocystis sp. TaxID=1962667 RepID=UPI002428EB57|nr:IgGFc-binding protein [Nannocystis sp.]MBK9757906.1 IgGFc-binding protein [Nannocystis sp.]
MRQDLRLHSLAAALVAVAACSDDGSTSSSGEASTGATTVTSGLTPGSTSDTPTSDPNTTVSTTPPTSGATDVVTSTGEPATTTTDPTATSAATTTDSTGPISASTSSTVGDTTMACACTPGEAGGCMGDQQLICADDCTGFEPAPCPMGESCKNDVCTALFCIPGEKVCEGEAATKTCNGQGEAFDPPVNCADTEGCSGGTCTSLCLLAEAEPSTIGCSFIASRVDNIYGNEIDSLVLGNTSKTKNASVQLYFTPNGTNVEQAQGAPVIVTPGKTQIFQMTNPPFDKVSGLRKGGNYRVQSTIPIIAYQHSPITGQATNDASVLFPEHALKQDYVISSWPDSHNAYPSYFNVIALVDGTTVKWTASQATLAGAGVPAVAAGATGQIMMNRFDTMQARANFGGDLTGTFVSADKPIWVVGAAECINVPNKGTLYCDHIQEQMLALDYWGKKYVGAHSPKRGTEKHYWRVFGGEDGTMVTTNPVQPGTPFMVNKAQWKEIIVPNNTSFIFESDKPFLPVQYLESQSGGAGTGDPAMYQMIPVEQFLDRYAFVTGQGYVVHYAQIIRLKGAADVKIDGAIVNGYYVVGEYEVADYKISEGAHLAESDSPFGIISVGYTDATSYAYPGGLKLAVINPQ